MILDTLDRLGNYGYISPLMDKVLEFFRTTDLSALEPGRIDLQGDDLFVNVNRQGAQTRDEAPIEAHQEYIDIQVPISSDEEMGFLSAPYMPAPSKPYNSDRDVAFYPVLCDTYLNVRKGMFVVFFPGEGHAPAITKDGILKLIVKIRKSC
ncbi:MAG: YhcH/YjgK/YiaL family protein [Bacteroidaceae bacterium]|nr:YhcH/YjgK/YiaL family protein [Bacteroidaceae bacterium]MBR5707558.1 YhcH/YjgK/YiaL family protein [Bacteroidaceae bacterium]